MRKCKKQFSVKHLPHVGGNPKTWNRIIKPQSIVFSIESCSQTDAKLISVALLGWILPVFWSFYFTPPPQVRTGLQRVGISMITAQTAKKPNSSMLWKLALILITLTRTQKKKKKSVGLKEILNTLPPRASPLLEGSYFVSERLMSLVVLLYF